MKLTFERIKKDCEPMKHLLVDEDGNEKLYLGFNRLGSLITDTPNGQMCDFYHEYEIKNWTIKEYKPTRRVNAWEWLEEKTGVAYKDRLSGIYYGAFKYIQKQHPDLEIEVEL